MNWTEDNIEEFVKENKDRFSKYEPERYHQEHFLIKLAKRFKEIISIVPYLMRVIIITTLVFIVSIFVWYNYIYKTKNHPIIDAIKEKIELRR